MKDQTVPHSACPRSFRIFACLAASVLSLATLASAALADGSGDPKSVSKDENGKYVDAQGNPTFHVSEDGTWDWYTYSGYRRYHSDCHVCHGPNGDGSSYAPALKDSLQKLSYADFASTIAGGRVNVTTSQNNVMPAFGNNPNVMCYLDDIFVYLRARSDGALDRVRPEKKEAKTQAYSKAEDSCMGAK
ncbi:MAG: c-type cytochrome, methanol metabolism-related [Hyphomicrobiales bacterium]|nr:c-type cytochrome, methanol metabolism-related [Hyphomicrobiales bacterium]